MNAWSQISALPSVFMALSVYSLQSTVTGDYHPILLGWKGTATELVPFGAAHGPIRIKRAAYFRCIPLTRHDWPQVSLYPSVRIQNNSVSASNSHIILVAVDESNHIANDTNLPLLWNQETHQKSYKVLWLYHHYKHANISQILIVWDNFNPTNRLRNCQTDTVVAFVGSIMSLL